MSGPDEDPGPVTLSEQGGVRYLHFGTEWIQGAMRISAPYDIELVYVQRMMAWLLFVKPRSVVRRHAMQLGLGAAAITKFCHVKLGMPCTAVEINPRVVAACRMWFQLPPDNERLQVVVADAGACIREPQRRGTVDALAVDLYDQHAAGPVLDGADFYADCRELLTADGCLSVNLFGRTRHFERSLGAIVEAFGARAVWVFRPTRAGNTVVLAHRHPKRPPQKQLRARARDIEARWGLPARHWPQVLRTLEK